jgi:dihydroorotate dehydrogenase
MYSHLSAAVSRMGAPHARKLAVQAIKFAATVAPTGTPLSLQRNIMGLTFPGPVGLAAGFDKHGELYPSLPRLGFGFAEIGSVIPLPELQRSRGLDAIVTILSRHPQPHPVPLGASISMNRRTPPERMAEDYLACLERLWRYADYFVVNLGVKAGPDLHLTEHRTALHKVLTSVSSTRSRLAKATGTKRPILIKLDCNRGDTDSLLDCAQNAALDGLVLSGDVEHGREALALSRLEQVARRLDSDIPIVSVGGIRTPQDAADRLSAGAALIQLYSGIVESGPLLPRRINARLSELSSD